MSDPEGSAIYNRRPRGGVLVVGAGGLGCPALLGLGPALDARGVRLGVADFDRVDLSNLQRQILHRTADVGEAKVESAAAALAWRWPGLDLERHHLRVGADNVANLIAGYEVVVDGTDSFAAKFLLNDACVAAGVPLVHGGVVGFTGQLMTIAGGSACYRCLFEEPPPPGAAPSCSEAGILGAFAGVIGALQAQEALALLDGRPALAGALLVVDGLRDRRRRVVVGRRAGCAAHPMQSEVQSSC